MLDEIRARNVGLIADAVLTPGQGLTVITGETGTGKTLILGALRLVSGGLASKATIGPHGNTAEVGARFIDDAGAELVVRRVLTSKRSRGYLDGLPATAAEIASTVGPLVSIVGQHDQHTLAASEGVRALIDGMFSGEQLQTLTVYAGAYRQLREVETEMEAIGADRRGLERELEMTRFQIAEIVDAGFGEGEEADLRNRLAKLRHAEEISTEIATASDALGGTGIEMALGAGLAALERIARLDPDALGLHDRLAAVATEANELSGDIGRYASSIEADPQVLARDEQRLADLSALKRKYGETISDINSFALSGQQRVDEIEALIVAAESLGERHGAALRMLDDAASALTDVRTALAARASDTAVKHLKDLGFADPVVRVALDEKDPGATGADRFSVLFASDASLDVAPIGTVASGGELSRLVLALTLACGVADADIVAFDEIDAGVGGATALAMGEKLASLARNRQVICVTHLPQVAAQGDHHFTVARDGTTAKITRLEGSARTEEISRMLAGMQGSDAAMGHAEELLGRTADQRERKGVA